MQRLRLASRLWLAILPIALAALLAGAFVAWSFLQESEAHAEAARSARVAESAMDALRGVWIEAEAVDATTWGVDVDTGAARDIANSSLAQLDRAAANLAAGARGEGRAVADSIVAAVGGARQALTEVRSHPATETDPTRYQPVTSLILEIVPNTAFFIEDRAQARELIAAGNLAEAARVTFGEEQVAAARPVLNFVTEVESSGDEELDGTAMAMLTAAEHEFVGWLTRAAAASPTAAAEISAAGIVEAPMVAELVDPSRLPVDRFEQVLTVAEGLAGKVALGSLADSTTARQQAGILVVVTGTVLLIAGWAAFATSRTVVRRVRTVTEAAKQIANVDLPNMVDALRNPQLQKFNAPSVVVPLEASHPDEVGELARSFGALHTTLIEVASQQMEILRKGVSEIFVTLARRNQALVDRQLALIDQLESSEEDPEILGGYYKLDHLATRMRRNAESLLVLAGTESPRVWGKPLAMGDVVRAALGEVDDYQRVDVLALEPARVSGSIVTDLAHLISELLDNAAQFSPPTERVRVTGLFDRAGYLLTISDGGIGMSDGRLAELNRMLESPPVLGLALEPTLGMYVVARLAARHQVTVELVAGVPGTTARITIPRALLEANDSRPAPTLQDHPEREALPHTLRAPVAEDPVPALSGAGAAPYPFRETAESSTHQPSGAGENGHRSDVPHPLLAHAATLTDESRGRPGPTSDEAEPVDAPPNGGDRPSLPTRRRPADAEPAGELPIRDRQESIEPNVDDHTGPTPTDEPSPGEQSPEPNVKAERTRSEPPPGTRISDGPQRRTGPSGPSASPSGGRRRSGLHRAAGRTERAPWDRSDDETAPSGAPRSEDASPERAAGDAPAPVTPISTGMADAASPVQSATGQDWWGPKGRTDEPKGADGAAPADEEVAEALPLRSPGMTFREASRSGDSSSPSRFGATGIRAALTAYRTGRESAEEVEEEGDES